MTKSEIASIIDHTQLAPQAGVKQITDLCLEARTYNFASVCVNPYYVPYAATELERTGVKVCTVIGFPLGCTTTGDQAREAETAVFNGADEIDMVINIGAALDGRFTVVGKDIAAVVRASKEAGEKNKKNVIVKVILETCFLDDKTIRDCCLCAKKAGADFVKTSTGFAAPKTKDGLALPNGATEHHVKLMRETVGPDMGVKASGGIRTVEKLVAMIEAGASRIGTSSGLTLVEQWNPSMAIKLPDFWNKK